MDVLTVIFVVSHDAPGGPIQQLAVGAARPSQLVDGRQPARSSERSIDG